MENLRVAQLDSTTPEYTKAFHTFLEHTDEKDKEQQWLDSQVRELMRLGTAIDAGAGTGKLTRWLTDRFTRVLGIEPNPSLAAEFRVTCPMAILIPQTILAANLQVAADFIVCSHVFYYIPRTEWEVHLRQLISWMAPGGVLAITLANPDADCMRMVNHFIGGYRGLRELASVAESAPGGPYDVRLETVESYIRTDNLQTACEIAAFVLNDQPTPNPPLWTDLEKYVSNQFSQPTGGYQYSCHQDILRVARNP
jgi:trans-aconitate methyltransferase